MISILISSRSSMVYVCYGGLLPLAAEGQNYSILYYDIIWYTILCYIKLHYIVRQHTII